MEKDIPGYEGLYIAKRDGTIHSNKRSGTPGKQLQPKVDADGYFRVNLSKDGNIETLFVHRLIAVCFIPNPGNKPTVDHKNSDRTDNRVMNLRWATEKEQQEYIQTSTESSDDGTDIYLNW